jgi:hypothetical protein
VLYESVVESSSYEGARTKQPLVHEAGLIGKSLDANLGMRALQAGFVNCWRRSVALWDKAFRWFARIGPTPRRPIAFCLMNGSARRLAGHFQSTLDRVAATNDLLLVLHDTTEFTYQRESSEAIGITKNINSGRDKAGRLRAHTVCGIMMHSSLAVTTQGLPLGLAAVKFWTRKNFKGIAAPKKKINLTRLPIEKRKASVG